MQRAALKWRNGVTELTTLDFNRAPSAIDIVGGYQTGGYVTCPRTPGDNRKTVRFNLRRVGTQRGTPCLFYEEESGT